MNQKEIGYNQVSTRTQREFKMITVWLGSEEITQIKKRTLTGLLNQKVHNAPPNKEGKDTMLDSGNGYLDRPLQVNYQYHNNDGNVISSQVENMRYRVDTAKYTTAKSRHRSFGNRDKMMEMSDPSHVECQAEHELQGLSV